MGILFYYLIGLNRGTSFLPLYTGAVLALGYVLSNLGALIEGKLSPRKVFADIFALFAFAVLATFIVEHFNPVVSVALISLLALVFLSARGWCKYRREEIGT